MYVRHESEKIGGHVFTEVNHASQSPFVHLRVLAGQCVFDRRQREGGRERESALTRPLGLRERERARERERERERERKSW